jgi:predicted nucleotidyltransferase
MELNKILERYQDDIIKATKLLKNEGCKAVFLFGSMVTGKIHQNSDIGIKGFPPKSFLG